MIWRRRRDSRRSTGVAFGPAFAGFLGTNPRPRASSGGGGGIRTPGALSGTVVFKTTALNHSATPPKGKVYPDYRKP